jgi:hypothetical protein
MVNNTVGGVTSAAATQTVHPAPVSGIQSEDRRTTDASSCQPAAQVTVFVTRLGVSLLGHQTDEKSGPS